MILSKEGFFIGTIGPEGIFKTFRESIREADKGLTKDGFGEEFRLLGESEKEEKVEVRWANAREEGILEIRTTPGEFFGAGKSETSFFYFDPEDSDFYRDPIFSLFDIFLSDNPVPGKEVFLITSKETGEAIAYFLTEEEAENYINGLGRAFRKLLEKR